MAKKQNLILITIDALRADHLGFMGYKKNISPNIDHLAKESSIFTKAFATGPVTPHSFPSILTSTYPLDYHGPRKIKRPRKLISEVLKREGFTTAAFHSNAFLGNFFGYNRGWDFFEDLQAPVNFSFLKEKKITAIIKEVVRRGIIQFFPQLFFLLIYIRYRIKKLKNNRINGSFLTQIVKDFISSQEEKSPFFVWVHYMDVHTPYSARDNLKNKPLSYSEYSASCSSPLLAIYSSTKLTKIAKKNINLTYNLYDDGIKYVDEQIGNLISFLKAKNIYDNCIIIVTADHGDEFLEHGSGSHQSRLYNEVLHVPLLIKTPGNPARVIKNPVSLIDLAPTICDILNIKRTPSFKGQNLFNRSNFPIFHQTGSRGEGGIFSSKIDFIRYCEIESINQCKLACQFKNWKYILNYDNKKEELYNLLADPKEQNNIVHSEPEVISKMRKILQEFAKKNPPLSSLSFSNEN